MTEMTENKGYHAHIYYNAETKPVAEKLGGVLAEKFAVRAGDLSDEPRGPHPVSQFAVIFETPEFQNIVPWLMLNREGLDVLVHPLTLDAVEDHSSYAIWLGNPVELKLHTLPHGRGGQLPRGVSA